MIPTLCNPVATQPYMNLPLKGSTNDTSINAQNPTNTGVTTTTGIFGESNGAYNWDTGTDKLEWSSSTGNIIATALNNDATISFYFKTSSILAGSGSPNLIFGQYITSVDANSSFYGGFNTSNSLIFGKVSSNTLSQLSDTAPVINNATYYFCSYVFSGNNVKFYLDGVETYSGTFPRIANQSANTVFKIGNFFPGTK